MSKITLATGPMFSGKSAWLIDVLSNFASTKKPFLAIRFANDNRYDTESIASHDGTKYPAKNAATAKEVRNLLDQNQQIELLAIDEIQFFEPSLTEILNDLRQNNTPVFAAGLDTDFLAMPWETTEAVREIADEVFTYQATCSVCNKKNATRTQRLINGKPAPSNSPRILIGDTQVYTARCTEHYEQA